MVTLLDQSQADGYAVRSESASAVETAYVLDRGRFVIPLRVQLVPVDSSVDMP